MSVINEDSVTRGGVKSANGRYVTASPDNIERVDGARLKQLFLPSLTPEANKLLREHDGFVRAQLHHYGVHYEPHEYIGQGTNLLKKALKAGKVQPAAEHPAVRRQHADPQCDKVPDNIFKLEDEMPEEWLETSSSGKVPDNIFKLEDEMPEEWLETSSSQYDKVPDNIFKLEDEMPEEWLETSSSDFASPGDLPTGMYFADIDGKLYTSERTEEEEEADAREKERAAKHAKYAASVRDKSGTPFLVGEYMIDCAAVEKGWDLRGADLTLSIWKTKLPGIFQADYHFGVFEGVMMLSADRDKLAYFAGEDGDSDVEETDEDDDNDGAAGSKRKGVKGRGALPPKKSKKGEPGKYFLLMCSRDTGTGEIDPTPEEGTITFPAPDYTTFIGKADMTLAGRGVEFTARKISSVPKKSYERWEDYSWAAYEHGRVSRWH